MKNRIAKLFAATFLLALLFLCIPQASAAAAPAEDFTYILQRDRIVLTEYIGTAAEVEIPASYTIDGKTYKTELDSAGLFQKNDQITEVTLCPGVTFADNSMEDLFYGCSALKQVTFSGVDTADVVTMRAMFYDCKNLKSIVGYENWNTGKLEDISFLFSGTESLGQVDLSRWDLSGLKNSGWCFQKCGAKTILLPENLAVISAGFFNHAYRYSGSSFTVPAGVKKIGYGHTFYDFGTAELTEILVAPGNTHYQSVDGILYSADGTELLGIPRSKEFPKGIYEIPEGIRFLGELSFSRNENVKTVILPDSLELYNVPERAADYTVGNDGGNLNPGLNLHIAIYCFTTVSAYEVKDSNPRYVSREGVVYSKDMTQLVAVPSRYDQRLVIPEGVRQWNEQAMWECGSGIDWLMGKCSGVSIPASMTQIDPGQLRKLNRMVDSLPYFTVSVADGNPAYYLQRGKLVEKPRISQAQVQLEQQTFVFDGEEKLPKVSVSLNGKTLEAGVDFTAQYKDNIHAGTGVLQLTGMGAYFGETQIPFNIEPAQPEYKDVPGVTATYGQTLSQIALPKNFYWMEEKTVGNAGEQIHYAKFDLGDPDYRVVEKIPVSVTVLPREVSLDVSSLRKWYAFTGKPVEPKLSDPEVPEEAYTLSCSGNLWFGQARVMARDVPGGNYTVSGEGTFLILPGPALLGAVLAVMILPLIIYKKKRRKERKTDGV